MKSSVDERREIAANLRYIAEHGAPEWATSAECIAICLKELYYPLWSGTEKLFSLLADLIEMEPERTCRMTKKGPEFVLAGWWECSECGPVYPPCNDEIAVWALQKCPRCGARVIWDE